MLVGDDYVLTNAVGEPLILPRPKLQAFVNHNLGKTDPEYDDLKSKHFLEDDDSSVAMELLALKTRTKLQFLKNFTSLHIIVVSLRCEHSCHYCQVSRQSDDRLAFDLSEEAAERAVRMIFRSPSPSIKIEFQGGEPLLNFDRVKQVVLRAKEINSIEARELQFVIATNLALVNDEMLAFCKEHAILVSTSLDGPEDLHNKNRPRPGRDSYQKATEGIRKAREVLGHDRVAALMTTTRASLPRVQEIIDEYLRQEMDGIFLRPLSPYGFAVRTKAITAYDRNAWLAFYREGLSYILDINKRGTRFVEFYSAVILTKMLTPFTPGYVDLVSPSGIGNGALVYNYDGDVYASDEGRMLAEMGDRRFRLGNLLRDSYEDIIYSDTLLDALEESFAASAPMCSECAFEPFCGADPVYHYATQKDYVGKKPLSDFCHRHMAMCRHLITLMREDPGTRDIFLSWVA
jgi:His-Xaa-Ser system radical SAM maturase HxsB